MKHLKTHTDTDILKQKKDKRIQKVPLSERKKTLMGKGWNGGP